MPEEEVCKCVSYVEKGALRLYKVNEDGSEHIVQFALEGQFLTDLYSFLANEPSILKLNLDIDEKLSVESSNDRSKKLESKLIRPGIAIREKSTLCFNLVFLNDIFSKEQLQILY